MSQREGAVSFAWQVGVHHVLKPTYANLIALEDLLAEKAQVSGEKNDGWGCFEET